MVEDDLLWTCLVEYYKLKLNAKLDFHIQEDAGFLYVVVEPPGCQRRGGVSLHR